MHVSVRDARTWRSATVVAALGLSVLGTAARAEAQATDERFDPGVTEAWLDVVDAHVPGERDGPLLAAAEWRSDQLRLVWVGAQVVLQAAHDTERSRFRVSPPGNSGPRAGDVAVGISPQAQIALRSLARRVLAADPTRVATRATLLHTDVATLAPEIAAKVASPLGSSNVKMLVGDGDSLGSEGVTIHWALARALVSTLTPTPSAHPFARDWYRATVALAQSVEFWDSHQLAQGLRFFPNDAVLLWLKGCQHEAYAAPLYQEFARRMARESIRPEIESAKKELGRAEDALRRALTADPSLTDARLRLGRVLAVRGERDNAIRELTRTIAERPDAVTEYFAWVFLGAEHQAAGALDRALEAFHRAAALMPNARIPHLALAQIARERGDRGALATALARAVDALPADDLAEPWWQYRATQGRKAAAWLDSLRAAARGATR